MRPRRPRLALVIRPLAAAFAGIYYAITQRTFTPLLWDVTAHRGCSSPDCRPDGFDQCSVPDHTERVMAIDMTDADIMNSWIQGGIGLFLVLMNLLAAVLPVRLAIRRTQRDARRRLADVS